MSNIKTYRKRPIEVEAIQIKADTITDILEWGEGKISIISDIDDRDVEVEIETGTGTHTASTSDWIIKGVDGNFYAVPYSTFYGLYEKAKDENFSENDSKDNDDCVITW